MTNICVAGLFGNYNSRTLRSKLHLGAEAVSRERQIIHGVVGTHEGREKFLHVAEAEYIGERVLRLCQENFADVGSGN